MHEQHFAMAFRDFTALSTGVMQLRYCRLAESTYKIAKCERKLNFMLSLQHIGIENTNQKIELSTGYLNGAFFSWRKLFF
jgi:hypothetical protein